MKLLYLVDQFPTASETFVAGEIRGIRDRGHEVTVAAFKRPNPENAGRLGKDLRSFIPTTQYLPRFSLSPILLHGFSLAAWRLNARLMQDATTSVRPLPRLGRAMVVANLVRKTGAEWIHAHWPRPTEIAMLAAEITGRPFSVSIHAHEVTHDAGHFAAVFERLSFATFCNAAAMELLLSKLPQDARGLSHLIYHGVDVDKFTRSEMPSLENGLRIVSAGRLTSTKGFDRLIRLVAQGRKSGLDVSLTIFGEGGERHRLESLILELNVGCAVTLAGWVSHEEIRESLSRHHVFALLADDTFHDGLPNVVLEAMAIGRPVLMSPLPAATEAVLNGKEGFILSRVDGIQEACERLKQISKNPAFLKALGDNAAESIRQNHDRSRFLNELSSLFRQYEGRS